MAFGFVIPFVLLCGSLFILSVADCRFCLFRSVFESFFYRIEGRWRYDFLAPEYVSTPRGLVASITPRVVLMYFVTLAVFFAFFLLGAYLSK